MYPVSVCTLRNQICPKNIGFPRSGPMGMELRMINPTKNREGFLGCISNEDER